MANAVGMINEGLWRRDKEFQAVPRLAQCTFCQILSQKDLDTAGVLTLHLDLLAKACDELTVDQLKADLALLEERRFVFVDYETDELLVRSYARLVSMTSQKNNAWRSVPKNSRLVGSEKLRHELAVELRRVGWKEARDLADEIDPVATPSEPPPNPVSSGSQVDTDLEGGPNPPSQVQVLVQGSSSVVGHLGEGEPPPRYCPKHPNGTDESCWACKSYREALEAWENQAIEVELGAKEREAAARSAAIRACGRCDHFGRVEIDEQGTLARCNHNQDREVSA